MTTEDRIRDRTDTTLDDMMSLDDALEKKRDLHSQRSDIEPGGLYERLKAEEAATRAERLRGLTDAEKILTRIKEFFGRGPLYDYRKKLEQAEAYHAQMQIISKNLETKIVDVTGKKQKAQHQLIIDEAEFQTNATIAVHYDRQLADASARYETAQNGSVDRAPATTDAMQGVQEITKLRQKLAEVNAENNRLAVRILTGREIVTNLDMQEHKLQNMYAGFEDQRVRVQGHLDLAHIRDDVLDGIKGTDSIDGVYKNVGAAIEGVVAMQRKLNLDSFEELSTAYQIRAPGTKQQPVAGKQFWQTVELFPRTGR
jgi:hypothetical protein